MARKKKEKAAKLPKRIAGVKVPKELREPGARLVAALRNPLLMDIAAAALVAAAVRLREPVAARPPDDAPRRLRPDSAPELGALLVAKAAGGKRKLARSAANGAVANGAPVSGEAVNVVAAEGATKPANAGGPRRGRQVDAVT